MYRQTLKRARIPQNKHILTYFVRNSFVSELQGVLNFNCFSYVRTFFTHSSRWKSSRNALYEALSIRC